MHQKLEENNDTNCKLHAACRDKFIFSNNQRNKTYRNKQLKCIALGKVKDIIGAAELTAYLVSVNMKKAVNYILCL